MTTVQEIEQAITKLPPEKLAEFRSWYTEFDAAQWDAQIESDVRAGKLDVFADKALDDLAQKRCKPLRSIMRVPNSGTPTINYRPK